ncbi:MAG: flagellar assembly protein FliX [Phycisphaeraceae bacterium]
MTFPSDIRNAMRECLLKILWAKDDIISFFRNNGCTPKDVAVVNKELSRARMIDTMFTHLASKPDRGLGQFRAMLHALVNWSHFDTFYFDKLKKLSRADAERAIEHLMQLQEIRDHKLSESRRRREKQVKEAQRPQKTLEKLKAVHIGLLQGDVPPQRRGYQLEQLLQDLAKLSGLTTTAPFRVNGEQIDGAIKFDGEHYIIEAKWEEQASSNESVYQFAGKIEGKMYGRGIFISMNGFSSHVVQSLVTGKALRTIFIDGGDLMVVLEGLVDFSDMIDKKVEAAQAKGLIYADPVTGAPKA